MTELVLVALFFMGAPLFLWLLFYVMSGRYRIPTEQLKAVGAVIALSLLVIVAIVVTT